MPKLNITTQVTATIDAAGTQKAPDWKCVVECAVEQVLVERAILSPGQSQVFLSDSSARQYVPADGDAPAFVFAEHPTKDGLIQVRSQGLFAGLSVPSAALIAHLVESVGNGTILLSGGGYVWEVGTVIYLPGEMYGDIGPWAAPNQGFWRVVSKSGGKYLLCRTETEVSTLGASEGITPTALSDIQVVECPGFLYVRGAPYTGTFGVVECSQDWLAIRPDSIVEDTTPTIDFLATAAIYALYARVETDREVEVHYQTADSVDAQRPRFFPVLPVVPGDPKNVGWAEVRSFFTDVSVKNTSDQKAVVSVILALPKAV